MKTLAIFSVVFFSITVVLGEDDFLRCPQGLMRDKYLRIFRTRCYQFAIFREVYWGDAEKECARHGGNLVTVSDYETQNFLIDVLTELKFKFNGIWIGYNDQQQEGQFKWSSGETAHFEYWAPGEPSFFASIEDCVIMKSTKGYHWEDHPCHLWPQHYTYICEYNMTPLSTLTMPIMSITNQTTLLPISPTVNMNIETSANIVQDSVDEE